jgi:hypothetical protein
MNRLPSPAPFPGLTSLRHLPLFFLLLGGVSPAVQGCSGGETEQGEQGMGGSGASATGGATGTGGATSTGGTTATTTGGATGAGGATATGGTGPTGTGGTKASGGATGTGGTTATGGTTGSGGSKPTGGTTGSGGTTATGGTTGIATGGTTGATGSCGSTTLNEDPFGCTFAWGTNTSGSASSYSYLQFVSNWVGSEIQQNGSITSCTGCSWLTKDVAPTNLIPVFYAYLIGYLGHANGFPDGNTSSSGASLTTGGAYVIRKYRSQIVAAYAYYAKQAYAVWPTKPLVWLLEGDFVQYTDSSEVNYPSASGSNPGAASTTVEALSYAELGQLAADITCAIKSNMPNAVVAIDHSTWNADDVTNSYWGAMKSVNYDMVWTTGVATANGFFSTGTTATSYNGKTATYQYLHTLTGKTILVDTSFGASAMGDTWSNTTAATIDARISDGVIAANVTTVPSNYSSAVGSLEPSLSMVCSK